VPKKIKKINTFSTKLAAWFYLSDSFIHDLNTCYVNVGSYVTVFSNIGNVGDQVTLLSPMKTYIGSTLLTFRYHMMISDEDTEAALTVFTYSQLGVYEQRLFEIRGNHGYSWQQAEVCLPEGTYRLAFVATHGLKFLSDVALDDIELNFEMHQRCVASAKGKYFTDSTTRRPP